MDEPVSGVEVTGVGAVAVVEFANPPLNLLTMRVRASIQEAAREVGSDRSVRAVVLRSSGDRAFSAGSDVREFPVDAVAGAKRARQEHACYDAVAGMPQPVVVALQGHVLGGGLELALAGDMRVAGDDVRLGLPEVGLGLFPSGGGTQRLARVVGASTAKRMMFFGEVVGTDEATRLGLVDDVVPAGRAADVALALATRIADQPALAVQAIKKAVDHGTEFGARSGQAMELELVSHLFTTRDAQEGVRAFLESRPARFDHA